MIITYCISVDYLHLCSERWQNFELLMIFEKLALLESRPFEKTFL